jgi:hypothetical protein
MDTIASTDHKDRLRVVPKLSTEDDLTRAKRALWDAEECFKSIIRHNAQARWNSPRLDHVVSEALKGLAACRRYYEGL